MGDIKLFRFTSDAVEELEGQSVAIEKSLQNLLEAHLDELLGVRFLDTEYFTGKRHGGRIDTLGIDENGCPVILEYKRAMNQNVINQGLYYLDWLLDHKAEFELLVMRKISREAAESIEFSSPRLLCIAGDFSKYDEHAVQQINRNIELIRYQRHGDDLLLLELVNTVQATDADAGASGKIHYTTVTDHLQKASTELSNLFENLKEFCLDLGDDVQMKTLKFYIAFKRLRNFCCVEVQTASSRLLLTVRVNPDEVSLEEGFTRDLRGIGHLGTGELEIKLHNADDLERAQELIIRSYEAS